MLKTLEIIFRSHVCLVSILGLAIHSVAIHRSAWAQNEFEERPEILRPRQARTEFERDRLDAAAKLASGRVLQKQNEPKSQQQALQLFQRAHRLDPGSAVILRQIVGSAQELEQDSIAARYAVILSELQPDNADFLTRLGALLTQQNDFSRAARMLEHALRIREKAPANAELVSLCLELGRLRFLLNDFPGAAEVFEKFNTALDHPDRYQLTEETRQRLLKNADVVYDMLGVTFLEVGRLDAAESAFRRGETAKSRPGILAFRLAAVALAKNDIQLAQKRLEEAFARDISDAGLEPLELLEKVERVRAEQSGKPSELLDRLRKFRETDPQSEFLAIFLGEKLIEAKLWDEALPIYNSSNIKTSAELLRGLIRIYQNRRDSRMLLNTLGRVVKLTDSLEPVADDLKDITSDKELLSMLMAEAQRLQEATPEPENNGVPFAAAHIALSVKNFELADLRFEWGLKTKENIVPMRIGWGITLFSQDQPERAAKVFQDLLASKTSGDQERAVNYYLAGALELAGRTDDALAAAERAIEGPAAPASLHARPAWVFYHAKRYEQAELRYRKLLEKFASDFASDDTRTTIREAKLVLSNISVVRKQIAEAEEWLEQILDEFPEDIGAFNDLGYLWADQNKRLARAAQMIETAVRAEPKNPAYQDSLGWVYFRQGKFDAAVVELEKASAGERTDGVVLDHLGDALWHRNDIEKNDRQRAMETWRRAVEVLKKDGNADELQKVESKIKMYESGK